MGVATLTAALALLLLLHIPGGEAQITCHTSSDCSDTGSSVSSHQECCLQSGTVAYNNGSCQECVVLGWRQAVQDDGSITMNPSFTAKETTPFYSLDIGYIKGTGFTTLTPTATFEDTDGGFAADAADVNLETGTLFVPGPMNSVRFQLRVDQLAMEPLEQFTLGLTPGFALPDEVVFIQNITVTIIDNDNVTIQFTERDYTRGEDAVPSQIPVAVVRTSDYGSRLANPITFRVVPLTYKQIEENMTQIPSGFELTENFDAPIFATAEDFNSTNIIGTFFPSNEVRDQIDTPIPFTNDDIDEVDQFFVVRLVQLSATNQDRVTIGRTFSQCVIEDEDSLMLSFEYTNYSVSENEQGILIRIKKEPRLDGTEAVTEINYTVSIQTSSSGEDREATEEVDFSIGATPFDFGIGEIRQRFFPEEQYLVFLVTIGNDLIFEGPESFKLVLSPVAGEPQFAPTPIKSETIVTIFDDDLLRIGFVETSKLVGEGRSFLVQVRMFDVDSLPSDLEIRLRVQTVAGTAGGDDYVPIVGLTPLDNPLLLNPFQDNHRIQNYTIVIEDDDRFEEDETFTLTLTDYPGTTSGAILRPDIYTVTITDTDTVTIGFERITYDVSEGDGTIWIKVVVLDGAIGVPSITLSVSTTDGSADGSDYSQLNDFQFDMLSGETSFIIDINITDDTLVENIETFTAGLSLVSPLSPQSLSSRIIINPPVTTVFIADNDAPLVQVTYVNDTIVGDPLFHIPIKSSNSSLEDIGLCYEIHGENDKYFNLVSDTCTSVNAHWTDVTWNLNVINVVAIRTVDNDGNCTEITISLIGSECLGEVNGMSVGTSYENAGILMRKSSRFERWKVIVPNCNDIRLEMWIICHANTILDPATNMEIQADMMKVVVQRGLNAGRMAHGLIGQFWNQEVSVQPYSGPVHESVRNYTHYQITMPNQRSFTAIHHDVNWIWEKVNCLYAGNHQGGPIYEVEDPNDPVIAGEYIDYIVPGPFSEQGYVYGLFDETQCST